MYLKSIELQGFKSFPDKTVLRFGKGITAVVGPNGSGKSNISDAMRWVLGEQSTKSLRGSKMEDVIFSGTDARRAVGFAEVTLCLDNTDRALNCDRDEVTVTRRYFRSGESEYKLNGETARLKDVHELFMDTGLGRDGYSMVSQGKVETLISGKSGERRDMLEEAAGISHYRYRRQDALRRLDQAEENLLRLRDILTELETRVGPLKQQSEKAKKFLEYSAEKKTLDIGLWLYTISKTRDSLRDYEKKTAVVEAQYNEVCRILDETGEKTEKAIEEAQRVTVLIDEMRRAASQLDEQAALIESKIAVHENSILHNNETIERIEREKNDETDTDAQISSQISETEEAIAALKSFIEEKRHSLEALSGELDTLGDKTGEFAEKNAELSESVSRLSLKIADNRVSASAYRTSADEISARLETLGAQKTGRDAIIDGLKKEKEKTQEELSNIEEKLSDLNNSLSGLELLCEKRLSKLNDFGEKETELKNELHIKESRRQMLSELEKNMEGYQGSVKAVMREARRGALGGINAPVSQLIKVGEKYSLAVETALGAQIQNIVTENENDAKRAISFLKDSKAGRATFLPLTAIRGRELDEKGLDDCYGYVNIASRLLEYDPKYREIINSLLGRCVVAEDLDAAVVIAKKYSHRFKIVTLDGQVINAGASMTGGAKLQNAGILSRGNEAVRLKTECEEIEEKLSQIKEELQKARESHAAVNAELIGCRSEITTLCENKIRVEGVLSLKNGQLSSLLDAQKEADEESESLALRKDELLKSAKECENTLVSLQNELSVKENELSLVTGDREAVQKRREELTAAASEINLAIATAQKEAEEKNEAVSRLVGRSVSHKDRLSQLDGEISEIENKNKELNNAILVFKDELRELKDGNISSKEKIDALIKEREGYEKESALLRVTERQKNDEKEKLGGEKARLSERRDAMERELEDTENKLFEEYELTRREAEELNIVIESVTDSRKRALELKAKIKALGTVNVSAIEEYKEVSERYEFMHSQVSDVEKAKAELIRLISELTEKMGVQFKEQFNKINQSFGETFTELFGGGKASLVLTDDNVLECDIDIKVQPPGKNVQNISLLSGGEKGLSAIALLFAILKVNPCPFCIFDEVEAALDDVNVVRYASYARRMTDSTQFILITHRRGTMEEADMLYGVTMQEKGVSKLLELKTAEMARQMGLE
ncbi:MAG: chromosome segregation protein SMC [Oscillospiraceae bacterium]|nr:chromosome segregation protein SMC [Oscillospiraceae bacterium]